LPADADISDVDIISQELCSLNLYDTAETPSHLEGAGRLGFNPASKGKKAAMAD